MKRISIGLILCSVVVAAACGSGGSGGGAAPSGLAAGFVPDQPAPGPDTVNAGQGSAGDDLVTVQINVTDTQDVYAAAFDLVYDDTQVTYMGWSPGALLEQGGNSVNYNVDGQTPGQLVVSASRQGNVPGANATGTVTVIELTFRVDQTGSTAIAYQANVLLDGQQQLQPITGIAWFGGSLTGI